jgi:predicted GNAT family N-acyltransferase
MQSVPNTFKIVLCGTSQYEAAVELRQAILRKPLGLCFSQEYLEKEKEYIHFAGLKNGEVVAAASLVPEQLTCKMRQVAVRADIQGLGVGSGLIDYCEAYAKAQKFQSLYCHARVEAVPFYTKKGYLYEGEYFMEIGIPHIKMIKELG